MDGNRRYADDPEPSWYSGQVRYPNPPEGLYDAGVPERPSSAFRLPEQREDDYLTPSPYVTPDPVTSTGSHGQEQARLPVRGPEYPTVRHSGGTSLADAAPTSPYAGGPSAPASAPPAPDPGPAPAGGTAGDYDDPTGAVPPVGRFQPETHPSDALYRTRRPVSAVLVMVVTAALMVPVIMLLVRATFDDQPLAHGVVPGVLLALGLPLTGMGLHALAGGGLVGRDAWLRPPAAYLPVGLVLLLAAGLAT